MPAHLFSTKLSTGRKKRGDRAFRLLPTAIIIADSGIFGKRYDCFRLRRKRLFFRKKPRKVVENVRVLWIICTHIKWLARRSPTRYRVRHALRCVSLRGDFTKKPFSDHFGRIITGMPGGSASWTSAQGPLALGRGSLRGGALQRLPRSPSAWSEPLSVSPVPIAVRRCRRRRGSPPRRRPPSPGKSRFRSRVPRRRRWPPRIPRA